MHAGIAVSSTVNATVPVVLDSLDPSPPALCASGPRQTQWDQGEFIQNGADRAALPGDKNIPLEIEVQVADVVATCLRIKCLSPLGIREVTARMLFILSVVL